MIPVVKVIIISWNQRNYLADCLEALQKQTYPALDISIVDNGSTDGSIEWLAINYPQLHLLLLGENRGFSHAFNQVVCSSTNPLILSLNPDVVVQSGFVFELVQAMNEDERIGIVAPKLLRAEDPSILDSTGLFIDRRRRPYDRGQGTDDHDQYNNNTEIFGACGAAVLYRRRMLDDLKIMGEYFDEDFFAYYEDADLAWRAQVRGWRSVYAPKAVAIHVRGWADTLRKHQGKNNAKGPRLALCNRYLMTVKNDSLKHFVMDMPLILLAEIPRLFYLAIRRPAALLGVTDFFRKVPKAYHKRQYIRRHSLIDDHLIRHWFTQSR